MNKAQDTTIKGFKNEVAGLENQLNMTERSTKADLKAKDASMKVAKAKADEEERERQLKEEQRLKQEEEERIAKEIRDIEAATAAAFIAKIAADSASASERKAEPEPEEGEVEEKADADKQEADKAVQEEAKDILGESKSPLRIDTGVSETPGVKRRPGPLDLSSTMNKPIAAPLPSALSTARRIEDIGSIEYPEGIKSPKVELNIDAKKGKFR